MKYNDIPAVNVEKKEKISVVIVTFNRKELLDKCIQGILNQSLRINRVYIINNASTDGTEKLAMKFNGVEFINRNVNDGGAGGFSYGIDLCLKDDSEWIWIMDDDVIPESDCLKNLLRYKNNSWLIHPVKITPAGKKFIWHQTLKPIFCDRIYSFIENKNDWKFATTNLACFEGALINKRLINKVGLPEKRYFIIDDDTVFGYRASKFTSIYYVENALMRRQLEDIPSKNFSWKTYYRIRNRLWLARSVHQIENINPYCSILIRFILSVYLLGIYSFASGDIKKIFKAISDGWKV
jgi:GT2 family glycosyltransferase